jgi:hypothetical protein
MNEEMPRNGIRILSIETIGSLIAMIFIGGMAYASLTGAQAETNRRVEAIEREQASLRRTMGAIELNVSVIRTTQDYMQEALKDQKTDVKRIREILERVPQK